MTLEAGARVGTYEIGGLLGRGAMGEVYRARDTRLGRAVAVKVLPAAFANDPERLSRIEREARLIAQVSHPNICTLFDIVEGHGAPILILELVEGETLQQRLLRGPMALRDALRCASDIAAALDAAHRKGIVHRDLKPSNIKITPAGAIKVLDFGVAKLALDSEPGAPDLTLTLGGTREGALVGTVAYVSPEQAMGERVDGRSDIWAFGCVLYEMLTATRAFPGVAVADTLAAVMRGEPDWSALPAGTPAPLRALLRRCLEKDRDRRLANIADARLELDDLVANPDPPKLGASVQPAPVRPRARRARLGSLMAFLAGVILASVMARVSFDQSGRELNPTPYDSSAVPAPAVEPSRRTSEAAPEMHRDMPNEPAQVKVPATVSETVPPETTTSTPPARSPAPTRTFISLPQGVRWARAVDGGVPNTLLAVSPDGALVVFSARTDDEPMLWLRSLTSDDVWPLPGTEGGISPFWSPDSASIGFFADRKLKRLDLNGLGSRTRDARQLSAPHTLCDVRSQRGGTWAPDGTIVFAPFPGPLKRISAGGGPVMPFTELNDDEPHHVRPHFFAGTRQLLYRVTSHNGRNNSYYSTSLDNRESWLITNLDSGNVAYAKGHLLYMQSHTLMAQPFDLGGGSITAPPRPIATGVLLSTGSPPVFGVFSASQTGTVVHLSEGGEVNDPMTVISNWWQGPQAR